MAHRIKCATDRGYRVFERTGFRGARLYLPAWLRQRLLVIYEQEQSAILCCHFEESLVFQRQLKKKVACSHRNKERQKANARSETARRPKCRHQGEPANGDTDKRQETAGPLDQKTPEPRILDFMGQKDAQRFSGTDEITERAGFVGENKFFVRHFDLDCKG